MKADFYPQWPAAAQGWVGYALAMCGRVTLTVDDPSEVAAWVEAEISAEDARIYRPRYNAAPSDVHWIVKADAGHRRMVPAAWGLKRTVKVKGAQRSKLLINARAETAWKQPAFRESMRQRRCLVMTDGFYEWKDKRPHWIHPPGGGPLLLAGIFDAAESQVAMPRFVILTTAANAEVAKLHDRMPAMIPKERVADWLGAPTADLLKPAPPEALDIREVSTRVNAVANDDALCLEPPLTLF